MDTELIFKNQTVLPNATSIQDTLKTAIAESKVFLISVIPSSISVGEFLICPQLFLKVDNDLLESSLQSVAHTCYPLLSVEQQDSTLTTRQTQTSQSVPATQASSAVAPVLSSMLFMLLLLLWNQTP